MSHPLLACTVHLTTIRANSQKETFQLDSSKSYDQSVGGLQQLGLTVKFGEETRGSNNSLYCFGFFFPDSPDQLKGRFPCLAIEFLLGSQFMALSGDSITPNGVTSIHIYYICFK